MIIGSVQIMDKKQLFKAHEFLIITFSTTHAALSAEKLLEETDLPYLIIPTPREISAGCGLAIRIFPESLAQVGRIIKKSGLAYEEVYKIEKTLGKPTISKVTE